MTSQQKKDWDINRFSERINNLSPERRKLLEAFLRKESPDSASHQANYVPPSNQVESLLTEIWARVFRLSRVGINDNFFELGGDSILSIQILALARKAGIELTSKKLFDHPTIAELSKVVSLTDDVEAASQAPAKHFPVTPAQRRILEMNGEELHRQGYLVLLEADQRYTLPLLEKAFGQVKSTYDALRLRFERLSNGWFQSVEAEEQPLRLPMIDVSALSDSPGMLSIDRAALQMWDCLEITKDSLIQAVLFNVGHGSSLHLLILIHHLIADEYSIGVILDALDRFCKQLSDGEPINADGQGKLYRVWAERIATIAQIDEPDQAIGQHLAQAISAVKPLPADFPDGINSCASATSITKYLEGAEAQILITDCPPTYHCRISELLIAPFVQTVCEWAGATSIVLDMEVEGRESSDAESDLMRTVGLLKSAFLLRFDLGGESRPAHTLKCVKDRLRTLPKSGINHEVLRNLSRDSELARKLEEQLSALIRFSYVGARSYESSRLRLVKEIGKLTTQSKGNRTNIIEVTAGIVGAQLMKIEWQFSANIYRRETINQLADKYMMYLKALIDQRRSEGGAAMLPSDFPEAELSQTDLDKIRARKIS